MDWILALCSNVSGDDPGGGDLGGDGPGGDGPCGDYPGGGDPGGDNPGGGDQWSGKGKGKAKAITPEFVAEEPPTDYDDGHFIDDMEEAKKNSLKEHQEEYPHTHGESSKQGANREWLESLEEQNEQRELDENRQIQKEEYLDAVKARKESVRTFNDILDKLEREGDSMDVDYKQHLLEESIKVKSDIESYTTCRDVLKDLYNISSCEEYSSEEDSSEEYSSEENKSEESNSEENNSEENNSKENNSKHSRNSSGEESRPSKRPIK